MLAISLFFALCTSLPADEPGTQTQSYWIAGAGAAAGLLEGGVIAPAWQTYVSRAPAYNRLQTLLLLASLDRPAAAAAIQSFRQEAQADYRHAVNLRFQGYGGSAALFAIAGWLVFRPPSHWDLSLTFALGSASAALAVRWAVQREKYANVIRNISYRITATGVASYASMPADRIALLSYYARLDERRTFVRARKLESGLAAAEFAFASAAFFYAFARSGASETTAIMAGPGRAGILILF